MLFIQILEYIYFFKFKRKNKLNAEILLNDICLHIYVHKHINIQVIMTISSSKL